MSKRFGRNQKRKLREELQAQREVSKSIGAALIRETEDHRQSERDLHRLIAAIESVNPYSICVPAKTIPWDNFRFPGEFGLPIRYKPLKPPTGLPNDRTVVPGLLAIDQVKLKRFLVEIFESPEKMSMDCHAILCSSGQSAYYITPNTVRDVGIDPARIAEHLAAWLQKSVLLQQMENENANKRMVSPWPQMR